MNRFVRAILAFTVVATVLAVAPAPAKDILGNDIAAPTGFVTMRDGTSIAISLRMPDHFVRGHRYPAILDMNGYEGGSAAGHTMTYELFGSGAPLSTDTRAQLLPPYYRNYVTMTASVRGTGCSAGQFDLFSWRSALDGYELIEWMARQPWSNGGVGIEGHSYSGITGFMIGATQPPHLVAMTVSGLIDDIYRAQAFPGGVQNTGFPVLWTIGIRPAYDVLGGSFQGIARPDPRDARQEAVREQCLKNVSTHRRTISNDPVVQGLTNDTDNDWYRSRSLLTYAHLIRVPIHITGGYQDEQTGARGPAHLWEAISGVPKRLVLSNGDHDTNNACCGPRQLIDDRLAWMDHWMRGDDRLAHSLGVAKAYRHPATVRVLFDNRVAKDKKGNEIQALNASARGFEIKDGTSFPLSDTRWVNYYLRAGNTLSLFPPRKLEAGDAYFSGSKRQSWNWEVSPTAGAPLTTHQTEDQATFASPPFTSPKAIVGPITANLWVSSLANDTEFFVQVIDQGPNGAWTYLQRGLLRAAYREVDPSHSDCVDRGNRRVFCSTDARGRLMPGLHVYRPYNPDTNTIAITPGSPVNYLVEVWPVGHLFRPGHRVIVTIEAPPASDSLNAYVMHTPPTINTILHDPRHLSYVTLPFVPITGMPIGPAVPCGGLVAVRCVQDPSIG